MSLQRGSVLTLAALLAASGLARAQTPSPAVPKEAASCPAASTAPRQRIDCLSEAQRTGEQRLEHAFAGALAAIRADATLQQVQRSRWINLMEEAQGRFVLWRNFECQNIAPYEGGGARTTVGGRLGGSGSIEQRLLCLIGHNGTRAADLERRYPPPAGWTPPAPPPAPAASEAPAAPEGPLRIIEMPR